MIKAPLNLAMLGDPAAEQFCDILGLTSFAPLTDPGCILIDPGSGLITEAGDTLITEAGDTLVTD